MGMMAWLAGGRSIALVSVLAAVAGGACSGKESLGTVRFLDQTRTVRGCTVVDVDRPADMEVTLALDERWGLSLARNPIDGDGHPLPDPAHAPLEVNPRRGGSMLRRLRCELGEAFVAAAKGDGLVVTVRATCAGDFPMQLDLTLPCKRGCARRARDAGRAPGAIDTRPIAPRRRTSCLSGPATGRRRRGGGCA
jgi:hypothetical protein